MTQPAPATQPASATQRPPLAWVAWIRLVAVLGVVAIHNAGANATAAKSGDHRLASLLGAALDIPFVVAVPMFVMVSGTLTLDPERFADTGAYLRKRVLRTLPAIVVWHAAYLAYLQLVWYPAPMSAGAVVRRILTGGLAPHLYFLWITLGLSLLAPILVRWLAHASRREQIVTGLALAALPAATTATRLVRDVPTVSVDTPWTWWSCYLGLFVLGWALRDVVLRGVPLVAAAVVGLGLLVLLTLQYVGSVRSPLLDQVAPVSYYGVSVVVASVLLFLVARATIRPGGVLGVLAGARVLRVVDPIAKATLGIYACHLLVLWMLMRAGVLTAPWQPAGALVLRWVLVAAIAIAVTLVARRIPVVRQVF